MYQDKRWPVQNYNVTPNFQRKKDKKLSYVQANMVCTHEGIYLRSEVLELVNYDQSKYGMYTCVHIFEIWGSWIGKLWPK